MVARIGIVHAIFCDIPCFVTIIRLGIDYSFKIEFWIIVDCGFSKGDKGITTLKIYQY